MEQNHELPKVYNPQDFEDRIYAMWSEKGYFTPDPKDNRPPFCIVIPPPNVTGQLHMGHALDETLQDILIRAKRMQGYNTLVGPRHRPRGHCNTDKSGRIPPQKRGHHPL